MLFSCSVFGFFPCRVYLQTLGPASLTCAAAPQHFLLKGADWVSRPARVALWQKPRRCFPRPDGEDWTRAEPRHGAGALGPAQAQPPPGSAGEAAWPEAVAPCAPRSGASSAWPRCFRVLERPGNSAEVVAQPTLASPCDFFLDTHAAFAWEMKWCINNL